MKHLVFLISLGIVAGTIWVIKTNTAPIMVTLLVLSFIGVFLQIPSTLKTKFVRQLNIAIFLSVAASAVMAIYGI